MDLRLSFWSTLAGAGWGVVALLLGGRAFGPSIWPGVLAAPAIGLLVGHWLHPHYANGSGRARIGWSLLSLYLGAVLFALPIGVAEDIRLSGPHHILGASTLEAMQATAWGVTLFLIALWPLAYWTHWIIESRQD